MAGFTMLVGDKSEATAVLGLFRPVETFGVL
jgi:hypothetical protein